MFFAIASKFQDGSLLEKTRSGHNCKVLCSCL